MTMKSKRQINIPKKAQWLSGTVGSGSWFSITDEESKYRIQKYFRVSDEKKCAFKSILGT